MSKTKKWTPYSYYNNDPKKIYQQYLNSDEWKEVRELVKERDGYRCLLCNAIEDKENKVFLSVHHRTYENKFNERDHLGDLVTMCRSCHDISHNIEKFKKMQKEYLSAKKQVNTEIKEIKEDFEKQNKDLKKNILKEKYHSAEIRNLSEDLIKEALYHNREVPEKTATTTLKSLSPEAKALHGQFKKLKSRLRVCFFKVDPNRPR